MNQVKPDGRIPRFGRGSACPPSILKRHGGFLRIEQSGRSKLLIARDFTQGDGSLRTSIWASSAAFALPSALSPGRDWPD